MHLVSTLSSQVVPERERMSVVDKLFGIFYILKLEPKVFSMAEQLAASYSGAYWEFVTLSNGGYYLFPRSKNLFSVSCENGFEGQLSADAFGLVCCLYAFSHLSFGDGDGQGDFVQTCGRHYYLLRDWAMGHVEARAILRAID